MLVASGCTSDGDKTATPRDDNPRGGALKVLLPEGFSIIGSLEPDFPPMDPQREYSYDSWAIFRCCLTRTLLAHPGRPTEDGGAELLPDLAVRLPDVSADGLTWTFRIREGIRYAPPLQDVVVTAEDFIRAFRREAKIGGDFYSYYYSVIQGFDDYAEGKSDAISGLEAPDPNTLVIKLVKPAGDLGHLMVAPGTAPIPPLPSGASAPFGIAQGHDEEGFGWYLVGTGPYMFEGTEKLDFLQRPDKQPKVSGLGFGKIRLVRNPSWTRSTDPIRPAYVDTIDLTAAEDTPALYDQVSSGGADLVFDFRPPQSSLLARAEKVRADPSLGTVYVGQRDFIRYVSMNLATPPFDDIAVRRAVNYALNKAKIHTALGGGFWGSPAGHIALDSLEHNLLVSYDPFGTPGDAGDPVRAKEQMARSRYDANRDGICDARVCRNITAASLSLSTFPKAAAEIARNLAVIGLELRIDAQPPIDMFDQISDPTTKTPLVLTIGWGKDFTNASNFFTPLFSKESLEHNNYSLLGATPEQLASWGYDVRSVPAVDDRIDQCLRLVGNPQVRCWASLDQYLMEEIVPWAPYSFESRVMIVSKRIVGFSFDQFANLPSLDRIALRPGS